MRTFYHLPRMFHKNNTPTNTASSPINFTVKSSHHPHHAPLHRFGSTIGRRQYPTLRRAGAGATTTGTAGCAAS